MMDCIFVYYLQNKKIIFNNPNMLNSSGSLYNGTNTTNYNCNFLLYRNLLQ